MKLGNKIFALIIYYFSILNFCLAEDKITTSPLINIDKIKPSFEVVDDETEKSVCVNPMRFRWFHKVLSDVDSVTKFDGQMHRKMTPFPSLRKWGYPTFFLHCF